MASQFMNQQPNFYSYKQTDFWCHVCRKSFKKLINSNAQEDTLCETCHAPCEEIEKNNRPQDFTLYDNNQRQEQQRQQRQAQQQAQAHAQHHHNHEHPQHFVVHFFMSPFTIVTDQDVFGQFAQPQQSLFDRLIQEFINNDPNNHGPAPAPEEKISSLNEVTIDANEKHEICAVCQEEYQKGDVCTKMPCEHNFHKNCVNEWLTRHNSCPICRKAI